MPEAIATSKRKFYKALDALSNPPATSYPPTEPAAKRVRRSVSSASSTTAQRRSSTTVNEELPSEELPNFSPWSKVAFLERLKTFSSVSRWHPKPEAIGEVQWAKRGWTCVDVNTVACKGGCGRRLMVSLDVRKNERSKTLTEDGTQDVGRREGDANVDDGEDEDPGLLEELLVDRYVAEIVNGHAQDCLWRKCGCKDDVYHLPIVRPSVWQPELRQRYQSLLALDDAIRDVTVKGLSRDTAPSCLPPERLLDDLPASILGLNSVLDERAKALEIAMHGWRGASESGNDLLHCDACFQRVGLWMYQLGYQSKRTKCAENGGAQNGTPTVDLIQLHREYCPWRNPDTQKSFGSLSGMNASQILQSVVATHALEQRRRTNEQHQAAPQKSDDQLVDDAKQLPTAVVSRLSKEEVGRQDKERDSRLRKLKALFAIKRRTVNKLTVIAQT